MNDLSNFRAFGEALAIGMLIGVERYRDQSPGEEKSAGMRTFTLFALLGAVCGLLGQLTLTLAIFAGLVLLIAIGYYRESERQIGLTTEAAGLLTFWLGYLAHDYETLAISIAIVVVILLASKRVLQSFVREKVSEVEFYDTLKFLAVVFVFYPLLPDRSMGPLGFLNPARVWMLVVLVSTISYSGYILMRWFGGGRGLELSGLVGGIVSTTAVTMSLADRARRTPALSRLCGIVGIMANAVQFPRLLLLVALVDLGLGAALALPLLAMGCLGLCGAWILSRSRPEGPTEPPDGIPLQNPYSLTPALKFGAFFVAIFFLTRLANVWLGERGILLASAIAGLGDASVISLSVADMVHSGSLSSSAAATSILVAVTMNALAKWALCLISGTRELAWWVGLGFLAMLGLGAILALLAGSL